MKILIVNSHENAGGAARAANRLLHGLISNGIDCEMLVAYPESKEPRVHPLFKHYSQFLTKLRSRLDQLLTKFYTNRSSTLFSPCLVPFSGIPEKINELKPDIVHLHWVAGGMVSIEDISRIKVPIVWSLHDMWAFTGGCHYDEYCGRFKENCGLCKVLGSRGEYDLSSFLHNKKKIGFNKISNLTIIGLSNWIAGLAKESSLFQSRTVVNLPNPIDTDIFNVCDKQEALQKYSLPKDKKIILFGAMGATSDPRKGYEHLKQALSYLPKNKDIELVVFGNDKDVQQDEMEGFRIHSVGVVHSDEELKSLYNCADVMVVPSIQENLSNAVMESLACGTPVVSFNIGGNKDMIDHELNGYLANPYDNRDLANGILWAINSNQEEVREKARNKVIDNFCSDKVIPRYLKLYQEILRSP